MPHLFRKSLTAVLVTALVAVHVAQVQTVFAKGVFSLDEAENSAGFLGTKIEGARDLVALIVEDGVWNDTQNYEGSELRQRVQRYAEDVQKALPKTQTLILPVSTEPQTVLKIQQVLERLFLEGDPEQNTPTQLKGVVLVGEVPLPVVHKKGQSFVSLLPYTDFSEPAYVFSTATQTYEPSDAVGEAKPEIWHGVIRAPMGGVDGRKQLAQYFDKNHLYHTGDPAYTKFQKKVLVSDLYHEEKNLNKTLFPRYLTFLTNMEDLAYHRYSAKWLELLQKKFDAKVKPIKEGSELVKGAMPDIQSMQPIKQYNLQYPQLFGTFFTMVAEWASGSGRWSADDMETLPGLIGKKDLFTMEYLRTVNDSIEKKIDTHLEKIQKPIGINRNVTAEGVYRTPYGQSSGFGSYVQYKEFPISTPAFPLLFINNSLLGMYSSYDELAKMIAGRDFSGSLHFINGVNFDDLSRVQQCSLYGGSQQKTPIANDSVGAVSQAVKFMRSLNLGTLNVADKQDPRRFPHLGITTRPLSPDEARKLTGNLFSYGARVETDSETGAPAKLPSYGPSNIKSGDIILTVNGKQITPQFPAESAIRGMVVWNDVKLEFWRPGLTSAATMTYKLPDVNFDHLTAGCYGINRQNTLDVAAGKANPKCFPEAARYPVGDRAGTVRIPDNEMMVDPDGLVSCNTYSSFDQFRNFVQGIYGQGQALKGVYDVLNMFRYSPNATLTPPENSHDPAKIFLLNPATVKDIPTGYTPFKPILTLQDLFDRYGTVNRQDDNGDHFDTNGNGKVDQIAWYDYNKNGKLDVWLNDQFLKYNAYKHPEENQSSEFQKLPVSLSAEEFRVIHPELFNGNQYRGMYTGEFIGGDWGVDEPSEATYAYKPAGATVEERWKQVQKDFFEVTSPLLFASPRPQATSKEYRKHLEVKNGSSGFQDNKQIDNCVGYGGTYCSADDTENVAALEQKTSEFWLKLTPNKEKDLSSVAYHKEPTASTLRAQFQGLLPIGLPIDKPRFASYLGVSGFGAGAVQKVVYPNVFESETLEAFITTLSTMEQQLGVPSGYLWSGLQGAEGVKLKSSLEWKMLSAEAKHQRVLTEYLNPGIDGYVDDSPNGYEAMHFVANGRSTYYTTNFSGEVPLIDGDEEYTKITSGYEVVGAVDGSGGEPNKKGSGASNTKQEVPSGKQFYDEPVDIFKWYGAMLVWWEDTKKSFKPLGLSLVKPSEGNTFNKTVNEGAAATSLMLQIGKTTLGVGGDSTMVTITAKDASGKIAKDDHVSGVWLNVEGVGGAGQANIIPDVNDLRAITFKGGTVKKAIFLSDGVATFQIVSGSKPQTLVVRAYGYNGAAQIQSESQNVSVSASVVGSGGSLGVPVDVPKSLSLTMSSGEFLFPGGESVARVKATLVDEKGQPVEDQVVKYEVFVAGAAEAVGLQDLSSGVPGYQVERVAESLQFDLQSKQNKGTAEVKMTATLLDGTAFQASKIVTVRDDLSVKMSASSSSVAADGAAQTIVTAELRDASGSVVNYNGPVAFTLSSETMGSFVNESPKQFINGKAIVGVRSGMVSGVLTVRADTVGLAAASVNIRMQPLGPSGVQVVSGVSSLALKGTTNVIVSLVDVNGNSVKGSGVPITARVTASTQKYGYVRNASGGLTNQTTVITQNGNAVFTVEARDTPGPIHLVFFSAGLTSDAFDIKTTGRTGIGQISGFQPNVLYASVLGGSFGNVTQQNYLAGGILFGGKTQAAASLTIDPRPNERLLSLNPYGGVERLSDLATTQVVPSGSGEPLQVSLRTGLGKTSAASLIIKHQTVPQLVQDFASVRGKAGVFVRSIESSSLSFVNKGGGISVREKNKEIAKVNGVGGIEVMDPRITLRVTEDEDVRYSVMTIDILLSGAVIGQAQIGFSAVNNVSLLTTKPASFVDFGNGVWLFSELKDEQYALETSYATYSSSDATGYSLVQMRSGSESKNTAPTLGSSSTSLEDGLSSPGVGFVGDNKHMLLLAARNTVGESHLPYASEIGIVLGDPSVRLQGDNVTSTTGFTSDLGKNITSGGPDAATLLPIDINSDGKKDLLVGDTSGKLRHLAYVGGAQRYADRGIAIDAMNGIRTAVTGDINNDGQEDVIIAAQQNCTTKDTCIDLYRNTKGMFVRENMKLAIDASLRISSMQIADMDKNNSQDLVVALTNGDVRLFKNQGGTFVAIGQTIGSFGPSQGNLQLLVSTKLPGASSMPGGSDSLPDILVMPPGSSPDKKLTYFFAPNYAKTEVLAATLDQKKSGEDLAKHLEDAVEPSNNNTPPPEGLDLYAQLTQQDSDGDGVPDFNDFVASTDGYMNATKQTIENLRCGGGGKACFPMPINKAFLVPGKENNNGSPGSFSDGLPILGAVGSCPYPIIPIWPLGCNFKDQAMNFRLYLSPTLTGQMAVAICFGGAYPIAQTGGGQCFTFALNLVSLIPGLDKLCESLSEGIGNVMKEAKSFGQSFGGDGHTVGIAGGGDGFDGTTDTSTSHKVHNLLGPYKAETITTTNFKVPGFPKGFTDLIDTQIEEVLDKLADLPDLYIMYPSLSSIASAVVPKVPSGKLSGYTKFLAYLNSIPLISIEPKPVAIRLPALSGAQIQKFKMDYEMWFEDFDVELIRVKGMFGCSKKPTNPGQVDLCQSIDVNAQKTLQKLQQIFTSLDDLKEMPKKLLEYRNIQTKYVGQIINYLKTVSTFTGGYVKRQEMRMQQWLDAAQQIKKILAKWQILVDITAEYNEGCDECKSERGSLFEWFTKLFVDIEGMMPKPVKIPKWPDIVLDFSQLEAGIHVAWPDVTFTPEQILLPKIPRFKLPVESLLPNVQLPLSDESFSDQDFSKSINFKSLKVDVDSIFADLIPDLPEIPTLPDLPDLPDLPPLPVFKLPDLPPAPKIPGFEVFGDIKLEKQVDLIKKALEIVCLLKKGFTPVDEANLKTKVEEITQRPLDPPLDIDLNVQIKSDPIPLGLPGIEAPDQFFVRGKFKFDLQTDFIYDFFKEFADMVNSYSTDLVKGANTKSKSLEKLSTDASEYRMVAEKEYVDISTLPKMEGESGTGYLAELQHGLEQWIADNGSLDASIAYQDAYSAQWITEFNERRLGRYIAQSGVADSVDSSTSSSYRQLAYTPPNPTGQISKTSEDIKKTYENYAQATHASLGIYIQNPNSGKAEKLVDYVAEMHRNPKEINVDVDGDGDSDAIYSFGGDVYLKENTKASPSDAFTAFVKGGSEVRSLEKMLPVLPAVHGVSADYSQKNAVTIFWNSAVQGVAGRAQPAGYEVVMRDRAGLVRRHYLYPEATGKIPFDANITVEPLEKAESHSVTLALDYGTKYFQVRALTDKGDRGTVSDIGLLAPQLCGENAAPLTSVGGPSERFVPVSKTVTIDASTSFDAKGDIASYFIDMNVAVDANKDGDPTNDPDISQASAVFMIGPFDKAQDVKIRVWSVNAQGAQGGQSMTIHVYVPNITLSSASLKDGTANGFLTPAEAQMPFSLVRERAGNATVLGDYVTDDQGKFAVMGLSTEGKMVVKNLKGEIVAEYSPATGKLTNIKSGYSVVADAANSQHLALVRLKDPAGAVLASFFQVPDVNTDTVIDESEFAYTPVTIGALSGVHLRDLNPQDAYVLRTIAANDPLYFGGTEIIDTQSAKRVAVIDSSGHVYLIGGQSALKLRDVPDMPYFFEVRAGMGSGSVPVAEMYISSPLSKPLMVLDGKQFEPVSLAGPLIGVGPSETPSNSVFTDVNEKSSIFDAVNLLESYDIVDGYAENGKQVFKPDQLISRAEFTKIVLKTLCIEPRPEAYQAPSPFYDIPFVEPTPWYYPFVKESFLRTMITGYLGEKNAAGLAPYKPLAFITRAESVKILVETLKMLEIISYKPVNPGPGETWYARAMEVAQGLTPYLVKPSEVASPFIVTKQEAAAPEQKMSRGDFAMMAARVLALRNCHDVPKKPELTPVKPEGVPSSKTSLLPPGIYAYLPDCLTCPCISTFDNTGMLLPGDTIFAILSTKNHAVVHRKSNTILLSP